MYSDEFLDFFEEKCPNLKPYLSGVVAIDMIRDLKNLGKAIFSFLMPPREIPREAIGFACQED